MSAETPSTPLSGRAQGAGGALLSVGCALSQRCKTPQMQVPEFRRTQDSAVRTATANGFSGKISSRGSAGRRKHASNNAAKLWQRQGGDKASDAVCSPASPPFSAVTAGLWRCGWVEQRLPPSNPRKTVPNCRKWAHAAATQPAARPTAHTAGPTRRDGPFWRHSRRATAELRPCAENTLLRGRRGPLWRQTQAENDAYLLRPIRLD